MMLVAQDAASFRASIPKPNSTTAIARNRRTLNILVSPEIEEPAAPLMRSASKANCRATA
jgi:hypothetical protein